MNLNKSDFEMYSPLVEGLRKDSILALLYNVWTVARRLILLYVAMFLAHQSWAQV